MGDGVRSIERLLRPRSVAVVGASATPGALGASVIANLERMRYAGEIYLRRPSAVRTSRTAQWTPLAPSSDRNCRRGGRRQQPRGTSRRCWR